MNEKIRELRKTLGLTLEKFGEKLGVKKNTVSQWENGKNITNQTISSICNVNWDGKHVNADWLRGDSDEMFLIDPDDELKALKDKYRMSDVEYTFLKEFFKLEPLRRESFFETLDKVFFAVHTEKADAAKSIEELEDEYKKSHSASVSKTDLPASNITSESEKAKRA